MPAHSRVKPSTEKSKGNKSAGTRGRRVGKNFERGLALMKSGSEVKTDEFFPHRESRQSLIGRGSTIELVRTVLIG